MEEAVVEGEEMEAFLAAEEVVMVGGGLKEERLEERREEARMAGMETTAESRVVGKVEEMPEAQGGQDSPTKTTPIR
eukprot:6165831-Prymnesium_polylepis.1